MPTFINVSTSNTVSMRINTDKIQQYYLGLYDDTSKPTIVLSDGSQHQLIDTTIADLDTLLSYTAPTGS